MKAQSRENDCRSETYIKYVQRIFRQRAPQEYLNALKGYGE